jgi:sulfur-oxidizing protein SoxX
MLFKEDAMRKSAKFLVTAAGATAVMMGALAFTPTQVAQAADAKALEKGKELAFHRKKGNCLACHKIKGGDLPGNIGPELVNMKARYPDKAKLRAQIWDASTTNPNTIMPPFGKFKMLTEKEIDLVTDFIYSL